MAIGIKEKTVKIIDYDPKWKEEYLKEEKALKIALSGYDVDIKHVGSTAIVGCKAKPIIDIAIGVPNLEYGKKLIPILQDMGYCYNGKADFGVRYFLKKCIDSIETYFIHIEATNSRIWQNHMVFKDYMNLNPEKVLEYSKLKEDLAKKFYDNRKEYTKSKEIFIKKIIDEAFLWFNIKPQGEDYTM